MHLLVSIFNNHHRSNNFIQKIKETLLWLKIEQIFSNSEIYNLFQSNNLLLLLVIQLKILPIDEFIKILKEDMSSINYKRFAYFWPEISGHLTETQKDITEKYFKERNVDYSNFELLNQKRSIGENDHFICEIIRNDEVEEFITYINKNSIEISSVINQSIFETNEFLMDKNVKLIEYAAFFGSIQIFQYLISNNAEFSQSLWIFIIHSQNAELIQIIENQNVISSPSIYLMIYFEAIKCHHNNIAEYIENNYLKKFDEIDPSIFNCFQFFNYNYLPDKMNNKTCFDNFCIYDYPFLLDTYLKSIDTYVNEKIIYKKMIFF